MRPQGKPHVPLPIYREDTGVSGTRAATTGSSSDHPSACRCGFQCITHAIKCLEVCQIVIDLDPAGTDKDGGDAACSIHSGTEYLSSLLPAIPSLTSPDYAQLTLLAKRHFGKWECSPGA